MKLAIKIASLYMLLSTLYIILSDRLVLNSHFADETIYDLSQVQTIKGILFVSITGVLLFFITYRSMRTIENERRRKIAVQRFAEDIISSIPEGIVLLDEKGHRIFSNRKLKELVPFNILSETGPFCDCIRSNEIKRLFAEYLPCKKTYEEKIIKNANDRWLKIRMSKLSIASGDQYSLYQCEDITGIKNAQLEILDDKKEFLSILERVPFGIMLFDQQGRLKFNNRMAGKLHPKFNANIALSRIPTVIHATEREEFKLKLAEATQVHGAMSIRARLETKTDMPLWCQFDLLPIATGRYKGFLLVHQDISAQVSSEDKHAHYLSELEKEVKTRTKQIQQKSTRLQESRQALTTLLSDVEKIRDKLIRTNAQLALANSELEAFSYSVSHDLRAPLRAINGFSQALAEDYSDKIDDTGRDYLNRIQKGTTKMTTLIDDMLALSRVSRSDINIDAINISKLVHEIIREMHEVYPDRVVEDEVQQSMWCEGDHRLLKILFTNLLSNAWKFTASNKIAKISVGIEKDEIFVRDNGVGFDEKYKDKIYEPFQRLNNSSEFSGSGIGLTIAKRIVDKHSGKIRVRSSVKAGTTFYLNFPKTGIAHCEIKNINATE